MDDVAESMAQAHEAASTGTVLARLEALDHLEAGRLADAAEAARTSLSWHRGHDEQSDAWLTLARVYHAQGRTDAASAGLASGAGAVAASGPPSALTPGIAIGNNNSAAATSAARDHQPNRRFVGSKLMISSNRL